MAKHNGANLVSMRYQAPTYTLLQKYSTLGVPGLISFMAYLYTHRGAKGVKTSKKLFYK